VEFDATEKRTAGNHGTDRSLEHADVLYRLAVLAVHGSDDSNDAMIPISSQDSIAVTNVESKHAITAKVFGRVRARRGNDETGEASQRYAVAASAGASTLAASMSGSIIASCTFARTA
jgi:hypothetical protein